MAAKFPLVATSVNSVPIRLTKERWLHIILTHKEVELFDYSRILKTIEDSDIVLKGSRNEPLAVKRVSGKNRWVVVAYKELSRHDGFVLTAFVTTNKKWLFKKEVLWSKQ